MSKEIFNHATEAWNEEIQREKIEGQYPKWPNEVMLKILFGGDHYLRTPFKPQSSWRVLDVGCGFANNLVPFADIGCDCHGVDLTSQMAATVQNVMDSRGFNVKIQAGNNRSLPFPDEYFDLLLSVNTLHYEGTEEKFEAALQEFRRVLKPGGGVYISTVGPEHEIQKRATLLGNHRYRVQDFGFRSGEEFYFCDSEQYLQFHCKKFFETVETGRVTEKLIKLPLDFLVALCR